MENFEYNKKIFSQIENISNYIVSLRHHFHENPELSMQEFETSNHVKSELTKMGISFTTCTETGVIAEIVGAKTSSEKTKVVGLRADIDALPINEETGCNFSSSKAGLMHACGHDGHIAMLLGACKVLNDNKEKFSGTVKLFFQPAEEDFGGGYMFLKEGKLDLVDSFFAIHLFSNLENNKVYVCDGPFTAANGTVDIIINGKGGHGGIPHEAVDPIVVASSVILNLQTIISRETNPHCASVISLGKITGGTVRNMIPNFVKIEGTTRTFDDFNRSKMEERIRRVATNTAAAFGATAEIEFIPYYDSVVNDKNCNNIVREIVKTNFGDEFLIEKEPMAIAEDFAAYTKKAPSSMVLLGASLPNENGEIFPQHHPRMMIDDNVLKTGVFLHVMYALNFLNCK